MKLKIVPMLMLSCLAFNAHAGKDRLKTSPKYFERIQNLLNEEKLKRERTEDVQAIQWQPTKPVVKSIVTLQIKDAQINGLPSNYSSYINFDEETKKVDVIQGLVSEFGPLNCSLQGIFNQTQYWAMESNTTVKVAKNPKNSQACTITFQAKNDPYAEREKSYTSQTPIAIYPTADQKYMLIRMPQGSLLKNFVIKNPLHK